jgi:hypothetical protein
MYKALNTKGLPLGLTALVSAIALLSIANRAHAIAPIGDDAELFVTGQVSGGYNDNIFLSSDSAQSDYIFDLVPGLSYEFGKTNSETTGQLAAYEDFQIYAKKSHLNSELFNGVFWTKYDDGKTKLNFDASFHQMDAAERTLQNLAYLVNRDLYHADVLGETQVTEKSSIGAGVVWDDTEYKAAGFASWRYWQIPVNYYVKFEPKLDLSAGFRYQNNTLGAGYPDSSDYFYNIGARGEFTPNLTGTLQIGYDNIHFDKGGSHNGLGLASALTYAYSPKTDATFGVNDNYGYGAIDGAFRDFGVYVGGNSSLTEQWSVNGQVAYNRYSYLASAQRDDNYSIRLGVNYVVSANTTLSASYTWSENNSNIHAFTYKDNMLSAAATLHF